MVLVFFNLSARFLDHVPCKRKEGITICLRYMIKYLISYLEISVLKVVIDPFSAILEGVKIVPAK